MTVPLQTTIVAYVANGVTTNFAYPFLITDDADLAFLIDGVRQTTGYTVTEVGDVDGGDVVVTPAPANGKKILIYLDQRLTRETDYQQFGDWQANTVNLDFDRIWLALRSVGNKGEFAIRAPLADGIKPAELQGIATRKEKFAYFNADGNVIAVSGNPTTPSTAIKVDDFRLPTDPAGDDTLPVQAFWDYVFSNPTVFADYSGDFNISATITIGPTVSASESKRFIFGSATYRTIAAIGIGVKFRNTSSVTIHGDFQVIGQGGYVFSTRTLDVGFATDGLCAGMIITGNLRANFCKLHGVMLQTNILSPGGQNEFISIDRILADGVGSGYSTQPTYCVTSTYASLIDTGGINSFGQRTQISVGTLPPTMLDSAYGAISETPTYINLNGEIYLIKSINRGAGQITVFPWVKNAPASGTLTYVFGAGLYSVGGDSNVYNIRNVVPINSGIGIALLGAYPGQIGVATVQACGVGLVFGAPEQVCQMGGIDGWYSEINDVDLLVGSAEIGLAWGAINNVFNFEYDKVQFLQPWEGTYRRAIGLKQFGLPMQGVTQLWQKAPQNADVTRQFSAVSIDSASPIRSFKGDNFTCYLGAYNAYRDKLYGQTMVWLIFYGSGPNNRVTGSVTIDANTGPGKLVNGAATVVYSNLKSPLLVQIVADPTTGNFTAIPIRTIPDPQDFIATPSGGVTVDTESRNAIAAMLTLLRDANLMKPS